MVPRYFSPRQNVCAAGGLETSSWKAGAPGAAVPTPYGWAPPAPHPARRSPQPPPARRRQVPGRDPGPRPAAPCPARLGPARPGAPGPPRGEAPSPARGSGRRGRGALPPPAARPARGTDAPRSRGARFPSVPPLFPPETSLKTGGGRGGALGRWARPPRAKLAVATPLPVCAPP